MSESLELVSYGFLCLLFRIFRVDFSTRYRTTSDPLADELVETIIFVVCAIVVNRY